jgi:hypothetical protein
VVTYLYEFLGLDSFHELGGELLLYSEDYSLVGSDSDGC